MRNKTLIHKRIARTWTGDPIELEYYLIFDAVLDGCAESYGVEVCSRSKTGMEYAGVGNITMLGTRILELIDLLAAGSVTPTGLSDVIEDWL